MTHAYSEDQFVEQPAIGLFAALGWQTVSTMEETLGAGGTLGRETGGELVLLPRLLSGLVAVDALAGAISDSPACPPQ
jgi:type I restriction enzyme, R subunit